MNDFLIFSDSACDLPQTLVAQYGIRIIPYYVSFDNVNYFREGIDIDNRRFYSALLTKKVFPKTSLPSILDYSDSFKSALEQGLDVLCLCLTSKFSGSYQSALNAKNILQEEYPESTITVIDSAQAGGGMGLIVLAAAKLKQAGKTIADIREIIDRLKQRSALYITVDSLEYLQHGGRIGKVSAFTGSLLDIKPIISLEDGELVPHSKVRGRKRALAEIMGMLVKDIGSDKDAYDVGVLHSDCYDEAVNLRDTLAANHGFPSDTPIYELGVTIGAHIGPTVLGVTYLKKAL